MYDSFDDLCGCNGNVARVEPFDHSVGPHPIMKLAGCNNCRPKLRPSQTPWLTLKMPLLLSANLRRFYLALFV